MWAFDLLGIGPDADERAVKRAYAAKLKVTRPEDDPEGFQRLVDARDTALLWIKNGWVEPFDRQDEDGPGKAGADMEGPEDIPAEARRGAAADGPDAGEATEGIVVDRPEPERAPGEPEGRSIDREAEPVVADRSTDGVGDPVRDGHDEPATDRERNFESEQEFGTDELFDELDDRVGALLSDPTGLAETEAWDGLLADAEDLGIRDRLLLERRIATGLDRLLGRLAEIPLRLERQPDADPGPLVERLANSFGWREDIRRLARLIGEGEMRPLIAAVEAIDGSDTPRRMSQDGFPLIEPFDLSAYFGPDREAWAGRYREAERVRAFPQGWSWTAFLSPAAWLTRRVSAVAGVAATVGTIALIGWQFEPIRSVGAARDFVSFLQVLVVARVVLATPALRMEVMRLARIVAKADKAAPGRTEERRSFIAKRRSGSRSLSVLAGLFFALMVDFYAAMVVVKAWHLPPAEAARALGTDGGGKSLVERIAAQAMIDHRERMLRRIEKSVSDLKRGRPVEAEKLYDATGAFMAQSLGRATIATYWRQAGRVQENLDLLARLAEETAPARLALPPTTPQP